MKTRGLRSYLAVLAAAGGVLALAGAAVAEPLHGVGLYGAQDLKRGPAEPFPYVNPAAPKGGQLTLYSMGGFTKLNPLSLKGIAAPDLELLFETPMTSSLADDEPSSAYGHLLESVDIAPDRLSMVGKIHPAARFSDGAPVTADDFVFSFRLMQDPEYDPMTRQYFADLKDVVKVDEHTVRYEFARVNQELPLILGQMVILPKHVYGAPGKSFARDFDAVAVGSGPYVVESYEFGKYITYKRNPDWWARDLPRCRGMYNFDRITFKVFLDETPMKEAVKGGDVDLMTVRIAKDWATDFRGAFVQNNYLVRKEIPHQIPARMQGFAFNLRRPLFQSQKVRYALAMVFDFQWSNANLFYNQYRRTANYFANNGDLTSPAAPSGKLLEYLTDLRARHGAAAVPKPVLEQPLTAPGEGVAADESLRQAGELLDSLGWVRGADGVRVKDGRRLGFELLLADQAFERVAEPYRDRLRKLGASMDLKTVQPPEYEKKLRAWDYDMIITNVGSGRSPGNELVAYFHSKSAVEPGSPNVLGLQNPAVDEVLGRLIQAQTRADLAFQVHALDHLLTNSHLVVPHWHLNYHRVLYWNRFGQPAVPCTQAYMETAAIMTWWADPEKEKRLREAMAAGKPMAP